MLSPLLFLCHITSDFHDAGSSQVRLFVVDCLLYREINTDTDHHILQAELMRLEEWSDTWRDAIQCQEVSNPQHQIEVILLLLPLQHHPETSPTNPYFGILLSEGLKWSPHIANITKKAN